MLHLQLFRPALITASTTRTVPLDCRLGRHSRHLLGNAIRLLLVDVARSIYGEFRLETYWHFGVQGYPAEIIVKASLMQQRLYDLVSKRRLREAAVVRRSLVLGLAQCLCVYFQSCSPSQPG